eukprot:2994739-Prymnesium_polylepis.1
MPLSESGDDEQRDDDEDELHDAEEEACGGLDVCKGHGDIEGIARGIAMLSDPARQHMEFLGLAQESLCCPDVNSFFLDLSDAALEDMNARARRQYLHGHPAGQAETALQLALDTDELQGLKTAIEKNAKTIEKFGPITSSAEVLARARQRHCELMAENVARPRAAPGLNPFAAPFIPVSPVRPGAGNHLGPGGPGGWPSTTGNPSGGGRSNNAPRD